MINAIQLRGLGSTHKWRGVFTQLKGLDKKRQLFHRDNLFDAPFSSKQLSTTISPATTKPPRHRYEGTLKELGLKFDSSTVKTVGGDRLERK